MFLVTMAVSQSIWNTIDCIFSWIEDHSVMVEVITAITVGSLWFHKFLMQKRAEAFFGFYARLMLLLKSLRTQLDDKNLLEINDPKNGNIYTLIYDVGTQKKECAGFHVPSDEELEVLKELASELRKTLSESDNNVYPKTSDKTKWYNSQQVLFEFCEFIERDNLHGNTNIANIPSENNEYKHTMKCQKLVAAMNYIQASIENENY